MPHRFGECRFGQTNPIRLWPNKANAVLAERSQFGFWQNEPNPVLAERTQSGFGRTNPIRFWPNEANAILAERSQFGFGRTKPIRFWPKRTQSGFGQTKPMRCWPNEANGAFIPALCNAARAGAEARRGARRFLPVAEPSLPGAGIRPCPRPRIPCLSRPGNGSATSCNAWRFRRRRGRSRQFPAARADPPPPGRVGITAR
jgi:hypothetical protein